MEFLANTGVALPVVSLAEKGCFFVYQNVVYAMESFNVQCVDAVGAGDAFIAGLINYLSDWNGSTLIERIGEDKNRLFSALLYASACGAMAVTENGCYSGVHKDKVSKLIAEQGERVLASVRVVGSRLS